MQDEADMFHCTDTIIMKGGKLPDWDPIFFIFVGFYLVFIV